VKLPLDAVGSNVNWGNAKALLAKAADIAAANTPRLRARDKLAFIVRLSIES
jgi:hypothetical protein